MANYFKASSSSSGFVIGTTVLLLLVVINIYGALFATACSSISSSKVMLFNSSSLDVVEQVAKDQAGITEFAIDDHHHELIQRRVLQGDSAVKAAEWAKKFSDLIGHVIDASKPFIPTPNETTQLKYILNQYCAMICSKSGATTGNYCACQNKDSKNVLQYAKVSRYCGPLITIYYCCDTVEKCSLCCGSGSSSSDINSNNQPYNQVPPPPSSGSPVAYVVMTVIAIFTTVSYMYVHLLI